MNDQPVHPARHHRYITTHSGERVYCPGIRTSQVHLCDIAHSLALQARYLGHTDGFYSVAEHSVLVSEIAARHNESPLVQKCALLHDAHEAYTGDFPSPFKEVVPELRDFEKQIEVVVHDRFSLPGIGDAVWKRIKVYDLAALHFEASELFPSAPSWVDEAQVAIVPEDIRDQGICQWDWRAAKAHFSGQARRLGLDPLA